MTGCARLGKVVLIPVGLFLLGTAAWSFFRESPICYSPVEPRLTRSTALALEAGIGHFQDIHHRFPFPAFRLDGGGRMRAQGDWMAELLRLSDMDIPMAKEGRGGLVKTADGWTLTDAWGEPYYLVSSDAADLPGYPQTITTKVLIYSSGPDRDPQTWDDNVVGW